ncbi:MAG: hypothetical protein SOZ47_05485 [Lawsonibacter sp.]|nr:hypothetical protein [Lawsonibacter sp.]
MITFQNWQLTESRELIARQYDNLSRRLEVTGELPDGWEWAMLVQVGSAMDVIALEPIEGGVGVTLTEDQLSQNGYYKMQLRGSQGDVVRHTNIISAFIPPSLSGTGQWPTVPSEFTQVERRIRELNEHPSIPGDHGFWLVWDLERHSYVESVFPLPAGGSGGTYFTTDETLTLKEGVLSVNTADAAEQDNTLPITSAAVHSAMGNIEALLKTI